MTFDQYLDRAWTDHANYANQVALGIHEGIALATGADQIASLATLITHVFGEHLGQWQKGIELTNALRAHPSLAEDDANAKSVDRARGALEVASGNESVIQKLDQSGKIRVLSIAASALASQNEIARASSLFAAAIAHAGGLDAKDPANRSLAVTGNNLAASLEEKESLSSAENQLMLLAARTGRQYWEIAGGWMEVERAEYRWAMSCLKAKDLVGALEHAQVCLEICEANSAPPLEHFFGYEALAKIENARGNTKGFQTARASAQTAFKQIDEKDRQWCLNALERLEKLS